MVTLEDVYPPFGLTIRCGLISMRVARDEDLPGLSEVAIGGLETGVGPMPFIRAWHHAPADELPINTARWHWETRQTATPQKWTMIFAVRVGGQLAGVQDLLGRDFLATRSLKTASWLGKRFHGRGHGTLMRQTICAFAFDHLDAEEMTSEYVEGNPTSPRVSEKVGYQPSGRHRLAREGGSWAWIHEVRLTPETFNRPPGPVEVEGAEAFRRFIGLQSERVPPPSR